MVEEMLVYNLFQNTSNKYMIKTTKFSTPLHIFKDNFFSLPFEEMKGY